MTMSKPYVVGIDIGGTNTVFGIVDARGTIIASGSIKTNKFNEVEDYVNELHTELFRLLEQNNATDKIMGIGVGAPNGNYFNGTIEFAPNLTCRGVIPIEQILTEHFGITVIMITLGTGVGSGIVVNGQLVYGHDGFAGELGHVIVRPNNGRLCGCGRTGCLEAYTSATGVARTAREFLEVRNDPSSLRQIPIQDITSKDVYDAAITGDKLALEIFDYTGKILGEAFANFIAFSSPKAIILFGGLAKAGDLILKPIKEAMDRNTLNIYKGKVKIMFSELKESDAAVLGASALGWEAK